MDGRFNTIAGWLLFGFILALGLTILSGKYFHADSPERPEQFGYVIQGVESAEAGGGGPALETLLQTADAAAGEKVFGKCTACHTINAGGANGIGPNLHGVMGEPIGTGHGGFAFSDALKAVGGNWDWQAMDAWLASPRKFANGTKMTFAGLSNPEDRANILVYLNNQGSNLPLPEAPVEEEAGEEGDAAAAEGEEAPAEGEEAAPAEGEAEAAPAA